MTNPDKNMPNQGVIVETASANPSQHPIAVGVGAVGAGAAAGALGGALGGPVGAVAGAVVGAVAGGLAGKATAEVIDPEIETRYWRESFSTRGNVDRAIKFEEYAPAYQYGWESFGRQTTSHSKFDAIEGDLRSGWDKAKGTSRLTWDQAKEASRDAWNRVQLAAHGHEKK
jgi:hypothetical protein